jgi:hypothetical protein
MALIYGFAKQTIVWLGEEADASFRGMLLLTGLARVSRLPSPEERAAAAINEFSNRDRWRALGDFMKRQWWQRTWVVQECVITRKVIIKCGYRELPWASLMSAVYFINLLRDTLPLCVGLVNTSAVSELELGRLRVASRGTEPPEDGRQLDTLLEALTRYRRRLATDPRDKIYAIMRLARDFRDMSCSTGQSPIEVNYSKSAEDVYFDTAKFFLRTEKPLEFLCHCRLTKILSSLSSWVPDWSDTNDFPRPFRSIRPPYADSAAYFQLFGSSLGVKGIRMGNVNVLGEVCTEVECLRTEASALFVRWRGIALDSLSTIIASEGNIDEQFIRVLVAEQHLGRTLDQQTMDDLVEAYQIWYGIAPTYKDRRHISEAMKVVDFIRSVRRACQGRRLFVSSKGSIGLAPRETTVGDSIAFILGQEFPLVLRQVILGQYLLVGSWYVYSGHSYYPLFTC